MAIPPVLCINYRHSGSVEVGRLLGGSSFVAVGASLPGTALEVFSANLNFHTNRVVQFRRTLFVHQGNQVFKYATDTATWVSVLTLGGNTTNDRSCGLHIAHGVSGPILFVAASSNTTAVTELRTSLTGEAGSWTNNTFGTSPNISGWGKSIVYRNNLYVSAMGSGDDMLAWDPVNKTQTTYEFTATNQKQQATSFCIFEGDLYCLVPQTAGGAPILYRFELGTFVAVQTLAVLQTGPSGIEVSGSTELFTDGTSMFALWQNRNGSSADHWHLTQLTTNGSTFTEQDRNANLPSDWKDGGGRTGAENMVEVFTDNETDPTTPTIHIFHMTNDSSGGARSYYLWPGVGVNWPAAVASISSNYALGNPKMGGGERFWSINDLNIYMAKIPIPILNAQTMTFIAEGDPTILSHGSVTGSFSVGETVTGSVSNATATVTRVNSTALTLEVGGVAGGPFVATDNLSTAGGSATNTAVAPVGGAADKTVKIFVNADEEIATTEATLQGTATGGTAIRVGNTVTQIIADGITEYTVDVAVVAMGLVPGQNVSWQFEVNP